MKDFDRGAGVAKQAFIPGNEPQDCLPAQIPCTVRKALLDAGRIPDPYLGYDNEKSLWTEEKEWWFFKKFSVGPELQGRWIEIEFEGTSFQGEVWLNGQEIGSLKGMLNPRAFDISATLKYGGQNELAVRLEATPDARMNEMARGLTWDSPRDQLYSIAQCMYGWDWGPHGVPVGLWRPVRLRVSGPLRMDHPYVRCQVPSPSQATCIVELEVQNLSNTPEGGSIVGVIRDMATGQAAAEIRQQVALGPGERQRITARAVIRNPRLWWPNGMGEQNLYTLHVTLSDAASVSDSLTTRFGIRELKLVNNENVAEFLKSMKDDEASPYRLGKAVGSYPWTFQVNGRKMFAKGGNWIPDDQLLRLDHDRYDRLLRLAKEAHFNLLRVWGGGLYETDDFYDLCDEYGILAWQEFLSNRSFSKIDRDNFMEGASSAVLRLRNHPSLTFWCGGNEFDPDDTGSKAVIDTLGGMLKQLDPQREFHRASPYMGDDHYWGVWHGQEPYTKYRVVRPFRSEAGVNAFPVLEDYVKFTPRALLWPPDTTYIEYHGEYNTGFEHLKKLSRYANEFGPSSSIAELIAKSELYQALANSFNMEFCRSNEFSNSGFLVWQYDDIWPCVSWSIVDWYGTPKASYYFMKRSSRPVHICADYERYLWKAGEKFTADVHLLNDTDLPVEGCTFKAKLLDVFGKALAVDSGAARAEANRSEKIGRIEYEIPPDMAGRTFFVSVGLTGKDRSSLSSALYPIAVSRSDEVDEYDNIFAEMNHMPQAGVSIDLSGTGFEAEGPGVSAGALRLANTTGCVAFFLRLRMVEESAQLRTSYSDNYVSLLPGEATTVEVRVEDRTFGAVSGPVHFEVSGWNSPARIVEVPLLKKR